MGGPRADGAFKWWKGGRQVVEGVRYFVDSNYFRAVNFLNLLFSDLARSELPPEYDCTPV